MEAQLTHEMRRRKYALYKELGMPQAEGMMEEAKRRRRELTTMRRQARELASLKFRAISRKQIGEKLKEGNLCWLGQSQGDPVAYIGGIVSSLILGTITGWILCGISIGFSKLPAMAVPFWYGAWLAVATAAIFVLKHLGTIAIHTQPLFRPKNPYQGYGANVRMFITARDMFTPSHWDKPLPYGALLAVSEAKRSGIGDFQIYYPVKENLVRIQADPVITGQTPSGIMVEVFSWDDGKVYE